MAAPSSDLDEQIERLRKGDTLLENEVKALCDKVSSNAEPDLCAASRHNILPTSLLRLLSDDVQRLGVNVNSE